MRKDGWTGRGERRAGRQVRTRRRGAASVLAAAVAFLVACEAAETDLPAAAVAELDGASPVPESLLPRDGLPVERVAVAIDGQTIFGSLRFDDGPTTDAPSDTRLVRWEWDGERWDGPEPLHFTFEGAGDGEVAIAPDGSYLLFSSARQTGQIGAGDRNLWLSQWRSGEDEGNETAGAGAEAGTEAGAGAGAAEDGAWSDPWMVPTIHSPDWDGGPTLSMTGSLYFSSARDHETPGRDLFVSTLEGAVWAAPRPLDALNSVAHDADPWIAPDESFLLFASDREGRWDLYISFSEDGGERWSEPQVLQTPVVTGADERAPALSPRGEVLFFTREGELWWVPSVEAGAAGPM